MGYRTAKLENEETWIVYLGEQHAPVELMFDNELAANLYSKLEIPLSYQCSKCGARGCKLYREYQTLHVELRCCVCSRDYMLECEKVNPEFYKPEHYSIDTLDANGLRDSDHGSKTDQIGFWIPAVPDEEGDGYWGYTSVPTEGVEWWKKLPTFPGGR